jgi:uncharacterized protein YqeY
VALLERIKTDSLTARKARNSRESTLLITLIGEAESVGKNAGNRPSTDEETLAVVQKFVKNLNEVLRVRPGDDQATFEQAILARYLPTQLTGAALSQAIEAVIAEAGLTTVTGKDLGVIMKGLKTAHAGAYDGAEANTLIRARVSA